MKLIICAKFHVNRMNCVESRRGVPLPPQKSVRVTIFSSRLLGLKQPARERQPGRLKTIELTIECNNFTWERNQLATFPW